MCKVLCAVLFSYFPTAVLLAARPTGLAIWDLRLRPQDRRVEVRMYDLSADLVDMAVE